SSSSPASINATLSAEGCRCSFRAEPGVTRPPATGGGVTSIVARTSIAGDARLGAMGLIAGRATLRGGRFVTSAGEHQVLAGSNFLDRNFLDIGVGQIVLCFGS